MFASALQNASAYRVLLIDLVVKAVLLQDADHSKQGIFHNKFERTAVKRD